MLWGTEEHLRALFPGAAVELTPRTVLVRMPSVDFWAEFFRRNFGPTLKAFEIVGPAGEAALAADLHALATEHNVSGDDTLVLPQQYVDAVIRP